ncbi:MAG: hypothetical protein KF782_15485, partial [Labilithrix sp.]|nr:hypothetical protein [Labilithrix sp.]
MTNGPGDCRSKWPIPPGAPRRPCRSCGTPICLVRTEGGRWMPVELDGVSHFDRCSSAAEHRAQLRNLVLALTHEERRVLEAIRRG